MRIIHTAGYIEAKKGKKKGLTYKGEHFDVNPFAICGKSVGSRKENPEKWEKCVQDVKKKSKTSQANSNIKRAIQSDTSCPSCSKKINKEILKGSSLCPHCGHDLSSYHLPVRGQKPQPPFPQIFTAKSQKNTKIAQIKTFEQIRKEEDPGGKKHDLTLTCSECGNTETCRCKASKRKFTGICNECSSKTV